MQKSNYLHLLLVFLVTLCLVSCEYDIIEQDQIVIPPDQEVSFDSDIIPIFTSGCTDCHDGGIDPDLRANNAYNSLTNGGYLNVDNPSDSELYKVLLEGSHSTRASAEEKQLILEWITRGANNN
ncbi:hypothetical protein L3049_00770 [Labilibaculum sp. DW002]|jgi:hypothetical protein|uniref:Cytochrome c domain-containing protein n=1 Tax=Paralabilibaculum antarcticum TaxID=2912572 RepID=A0ABT5VMN6_9BACT|nr:MULTISPECIES: hypothetical protein [unclassified Labilibaculum]MBI9059419.1 hypothetical protein [Labilibaculum sp.]MDE5416520.1 hypothetical protein [Labilibaculum sp. DW002]